jgi:hypothetical protein
MRAPARERGPLGVLLSQVHRHTDERALDGANGYRGQSGAMRLKGPTATHSTAVCALYNTLCEDQRNNTGTCLR